MHRHRIAPEIGDLIADLRDEGQLKLYADRVTNYREHRDGVEVTFRDRRSGTMQVIVVDRVIKCTGSESDCRRIEDPLIVSLFAQGLASPDPLFLGLEVDEEGALLDCRKTPLQSLYAIAPVRKGCLWETTAVPLFLRFGHKLHNWPSISCLDRGDKQEMRVADCLKPPCEW